MVDSLDSLFDGWFAERLLAGSAESVVGGFDSMDNKLIGSAEGCLIQTGPLNKLRTVAEKERALKNALVESTQS